MQQSVHADELRKQQQVLAEQHAALKIELRRFDQLNYLTTSEDQERKSLQKQKLATKDQLVRIESALRSLDA